MADDRFRQGRPDDNGIGSSPWSEYRRLVLAELERINTLAEQLRNDVNRSGARLSIIEDRINDCIRATEACRKDLDAISVRIKETRSIIGGMASKLGIEPGTLWVTIVVVMLAAILVGEPFVSILGRIVGALG